MAKTVNLGDKYTHRLTLRLTDAQMDFLTKMSTLMGCSPSEYLRMMINSSAITVGSKIDGFLDGSIWEKMIKTEEVERLENVKTDSNDKL